MVREILQWIVPGIVIVAWFAWFAWLMKKPKNYKLSFGDMLVLCFGICILIVIAIFLVLVIIRFFIWLY
jgi:O-antigen/teichoic acid export membrane protein